MCDTCSITNFDLNNFVQDLHNVTYQIQYSNQNLTFCKVVGLYQSWDHWGAPSFDRKGMVWKNFVEDNKTINIKAMFCFKDEDILIYMNNIRLYKAIDLFGLVSLESKVNTYKCDVLLLHGLGFVCLTDDQARWHHMFYESQDV